MKIKCTTIVRSRVTLRKRMSSAAFTLVEIMVVMILLSVIVLGLMAMFGQTQRAFQAGMAQTDQMEGGRMYTDLLVRDLQQITPTHETNGMNFYAQIPAQLNGYPPYTPLQLTLPASSNLLRTNLLQNLFFTSRYNQTWSGIGYFVRTNPSFYGYVSQVGTLYRFETNMPISQMGGDNSLLPYLTYLSATNNQLNVSKILDGVVEFRVRCYDPNGLLLTNGSPSIVSNSYWTITNTTAIALPYPQDEVAFYGFSNNIVPAYVEVQVGVLEPAVLKRYRSIPDPTAQAKFLANHAGNVQLFRQRVAVRNVDPSAYNP